MIWIRGLFHVHTRASFDGITSTRRVFRYCRARGIRLVAITDHDVLSVTPAVRQEAVDHGCVAIPGCEFATDAGDIVGLFVEHGPRSTRVADVLDAIAEQDGLSVLVHPYYAHRLTEIPLERIDIIETFNARCAPTANAKAEALCRESGKPAWAGADAHMPWELGQAVTSLGASENVDLDDPAVVKRLLLEAPRRIEGRRAGRLSVRLSGVVKGVKQKDWRTVLANMSPL